MSATSGSAALLFADAPQRILSGPPLVHVRGVSGAAGCLLAEALRRHGPRPIIYVVPTAKQASDALRDLSAAAPSARIASLPAPEFSPYEPVRVDRLIRMERAACLGLLDEDELDFVVTSAEGWARRVPPTAVLRAFTLRLAVQDDVDLSALPHALTAAGYGRVPLVEDMGTFALRGDIIDIWPAGSEVPARVELEFERISTLRPFDPLSQLSESGSSWQELVVYPAREALLTEGGESRLRETILSLADAVNLPSSKTRRLIDDLLSGRSFAGGDGFLPAFVELEPLHRRLPENSLLVFEDGARVVETSDALLEQARASYDSRADSPAFPPESHYLSERELAASIEGRRVVACHQLAVSAGQSEGFAALASPPIDTSESGLDLGTTDHSALSERLRQARKGAGAGRGLEPLAEQLQAWQEQQLAVFLSARVPSQLDRLRSLLDHRGFDVVDGAPPWLADDAARAAKARGDLPPLRAGLTRLARGFVAPHFGFALLTEEEIFGKRTHQRRRSHKRLVDAVDDLRSLSVGDYVVHVEHGIGRYLGLTHREVENTKVELLSVEYAGGDKLHLPVYRLNQIQKFSSSDKTPKLDKLGGQSFAKTKSRVKKRVREIADQLLQLYAQRRALGRAPLPEPDDDFAAFEAAFPYEETPDQAAAIRDVIEDLTGETVMDRLVCGDVGFGKTEVALRAAYLNVLAGRQVGLLCPTTVLAEQHFHTFSERLRDSGAVVKVLSRFQGKKESERTLAGLKAGTVDVVVGTHRLLSPDVQFKILGLLVIDEEQRFGVTHKERIKEIRKNVDVLTLTATPIPRTLGMAVSGLRDMSVISTPPMDRRTIRTFVSQFDESLVVKAIEREVQRGGQVFYVYNRVEGIHERSELLRRLMPNLRLGVAHGQMTERALEKTMMGFVDGDFDVLVATAIIESGLDIPRANTIIVDRADLFGLSQLYQIRGRVGRSRERAYCYLLVPPSARLSDEARRRIEALERHTELGSSFQIANLDMELRGTGEILGAEQSGFVSRVGLELFSDMLEQATTELSGREWRPDVDPDLSIDAEALLPEDYIEDIGVRLSLYKRLARAEDEGEVGTIAAEMNDRFGHPPDEARRLVEVMRLKTELRHLRATALSATKTTASLHFRQDTPLSAAKLAQWVSERPKRYSLSPSGQLTRRAGKDAQYLSGLEHAGRFIEELKDL